MGLMNQIKKNCLVKDFCEKEYTKNRHDLYKSINRLKEYKERESEQKKLILNLL